MKKELTIYWLVPAEPYRALFREIIRILSNELDAPRFEPHLTLGPASDSASARHALRELPTGEIRLRLREVAFSAKYTKTLFIRFQPNKSLETLTSELGVNRKMLRDPHLSLIYKRLPPAAKRELAATIKLPFRHVIFDQVQVLRCVSPIARAAEVESWRVIARKRLTAGHRQ